MTHLRQRMIEDMGIRNLADNTQSAYLQQIISYAEHFHRSPEELGPEAGSHLPALFDEYPEAFAEQYQCRHRRTALSVQSHTQTRLGRR